MLGYKNWKCKCTECILFNKLFSECHLTHETASKNSKIKLLGLLAVMLTHQRNVMSVMSLFWLVIMLKKRNNNMNILSQQMKILSEKGCLSPWKCNAVYIYIFFLVACLSVQSKWPVNLMFVRTNGHLGWTSSFDQPLFWGLELAIIIYVLTSLAKGNCFPLNCLNKLIIFTLHAKNWIGKNF